MNKIRKLLEFFRILRKNKDVSSCLRPVALVTIFTLSFILPTELWAEDCVMDEPQFTRTCRSALDNGITEKGEYICGTDCTFTIEGTTVKIKANSANARINEGIFSPYYYSDKKFVTSDNKEVSFNKIELDGDFAYIGDYAFSNSGATITSTSGVLNINDIGRKVFKSNKNRNTILDAAVYISSDNSTNNQTFQLANIKGDLVFADGVTNISSDWFIGGAKIDGNVIIPTSVNYIGGSNHITLRDSLNEGNKIYCNNDNCYDLFKNTCYNHANNAYRSGCVEQLDEWVENGTLSKYPDGCTKLGLGLTCSKCANSNFRLENDYCYRRSYTPAEAAQVVGEQNTIFLYYK